MRREYALSPSLCGSLRVQIFDRDTHVCCLNGAPNKFISNRRGHHSVWTVADGLEETSSRKHHSTWSPTTIHLKIGVAMSEDTGVDCGLYN